MTSRSLRMPLAAGALFVPAVAHAHLVNSGLGPFYDGISHLVLTPDDALLVVALALLAGQGGAVVGRAVLLALPASWLVGAMTGLAWPIGSYFPAAAWFSLLVPGLLVAAGARPGSFLAAALATAFGLLHGYANGAAMASLSAGVLAVAGIVATVFVIVALFAAASVTARESWTRIVVRVAGSWISAIALLAIGWSLRRG